MITTTDPATIQRRCAHGVGCAEVVDRTRAAEIAKYVFGADELADRLLATAQRWAELHDHGNTIDGQVPR